MQKSVQIFASQPRSRSVITNTVYCPKGLVGKFQRKFIHPFLLQNYFFRRSRLKIPEKRERTFAFAFAIYFCEQKKISINTVPGVSRHNLNAGMPENFSGRIIAIGKFGEDGLFFEKKGWRIFFREKGVKTFFFEKY